MVSLTSAAPLPDPPTFDKLDTSGSFYILSESSSLRPDNYCIAFLPDRPPPKSSLTLAESWAVPGVYLFLNIARTSPLFKADFETILRQYLTGPRDSVRVLWIENPADPLSSWRANTLALQRDSGSSTATLRRIAQLDFRNFSLFIARNVRFDLNETENGFVFSRTAADAEDFFLETDAGATQLKGVGETIALPLLGETAGCLQFDLTLKKPSSGTSATIPEGYTELKALNAGLRLFFKDPAASSDTDFAVQSNHYPFLSEDATSLKFYDSAGLTLYVTLDLLNLLEASRTFLGFVNPQNGKKANALPSGYRTNIGYTVHLTPRDRACRLIFAEMPDSLAAGDFLPSLYLVPAGDYEMTVPRYETNPAANSAVYDNNLLCGLSGTEYIKLSTQKTNVLCLRPGFAAFAPKFVPNQAMDKPDQDGLLTSFATTAWAFVQQVDSSPIYYAQPDQAVLYAPQTNYALLSYLEIPATALPKSTGDDLPLFPLLPYGGVTGESLATYQQLEQQLLSPKRRSVITEHADHTAPFPTSDRSTGTTPQGLLAKFSSDRSMLTSLTLAQDTAGKLLQFHNIERQSPLRAALQSNPLFLVISNPTSLKDYFSNAQPDQLTNQLTIQGWTFKLDPAVWRKDTVLIFKFHDKPLLDLLRNTETWSQAGHFNTVPDNTSDLLVGIFEAAIARNGEDAPQKDRENYGPLARIAQTAAWSGIVALNIPISPDELPPDLMAIAAGIPDPSKFFAQYIGIESTPTETKDGTLVAKQSSLFGLIDYQNQSVPIPNDDGYDFALQSLRVLFQNSQVQAFSSEISITLDRLFDEKTRLLDSPSDRNLIVLKGTAESHNGKTTYAFSFSGENHFALPTSVALNEVEIIKAQFSTDPVTTTVTGRFTFWGRLNFKRLGSDQTPFDIFSFGSNPPASSLPPAPSVPSSPNDQFLSFSNLVVTMSFPKSNPQARVFAFDPGRLAFDTHRSKPRADSVYAKFPLKLTGILYSPGDKKLDEFGYMPVKAPQSDKIAPIYKLTRSAIANLQAKLPNDVVQKLDSLKNREFRAEGQFIAAVTQAIGSDAATTNQTTILNSARQFLWYGLTFELELGSLGALAGKAGLVASMIVAWVPGSSKGVYVGLRLPGSTGGKREITIQGVLKIVFKSIEFVSGRNQGRVSYVLKLKNIMLKFLVLSIPPSGRTEIIIFGDPAGTAENNTVGWYAAYVKEQQ